MNLKSEEPRANIHGQFEDIQMICTKGSSTKDPEMSLWIAVLNQAVRDAKALVQKVKKDPALWSNPLFSSEVIHLKRYFQSQSVEPGSFIFICDLMGMNPVNTAKQINEKYLQNLIPITKRHTHTTRLLAV